jgi:S-formylglutathione hydrolase FrmB
VAVGAQEDKTGSQGMSRRSLLLRAGLAGVAASGLAVGAAVGDSPIDLVWRHTFGGTDATTTGQLASSGVAANTVVERVYSPARGRAVDMVTFLPDIRPSVHRRLPVCLLLHGLHGNARGAAPPGLVTTLGAAVAQRAVPPFAFVALDGGDSYWHENHPGDDPMGMLLDEVPGWLATRGLGDQQGVPFACAGVSMGGFGALLYARRRHERHDPISAVAAISPGLLTSWQQMSTRHAFQDAAQWASLDPVRNVPALGSVPVGVWCGLQDPFIVGTREFAALAHPQVVGTWNGVHDGAFFGSTVPGVLGFLGRYAPRAVSVA